ncbi:MAG: 5-formyltetrahydrofolate cyclo-ligase [Planctomycetota bacterium]|nr:5-formyltetrahydrofolate cyclo-ligase [Planctomycetota bacterium]
MTHDDDKALKAQKKQLRSQMQQALLAMTSEQVSQASEALCRRVTALPEFVQAASVMVFIPIAGEVATLGIAQAAWAAGKTVLAPKIVWNTHEMVALPCRSFQEGMVTARYGLLEPREGTPHRPDAIDLVIVPGLAFDRHGRRLGRGAGFYDNFLATPGLRAVTCAVAFDRQLVRAVPAGRYDWPVQMLVTDTQVLRFT